MILLNATNNFNFNSEINKYASDSINIDLKTITFIYMVTLVLLMKMQKFRSNYYKLGN